MAKYARLPDGTRLRFPDDATDEAMDRAIRERTRTEQGNSIVDPLPPMSLKDRATGVLDVAQSGLRGMVNYPAEVAAGVGGAIAGAVDPTITARQGYQDAKTRARQQITEGQGVVQSEHLRTPQGVRTAQAIGELPGISHMGRAIENIGSGIEHYAGPEARDVIGAGLSLATLRAPRVGRGSPAANQAVQRARQAGYTVPPTTTLGEGAYAGTKTERTAAGLGGSTQVNAKIVERNQQVTDRLAAQAGGLGGELPSPANLQRSVDEAHAAYDALKTFDVPVPLASSPTYAQRVADLGQGVAGFQSRPNRLVRTLQRELNTATPRVPNIVDKVRELRQQSFKNIGSDDVARQELGHAQRQAANILDDELDAFMQQAASQSNNPNLTSLLGRLHQEYTRARQQLSVLHDVSDAMNPATGSIDAAKIARLADSHTLNPQLQQIADAYNTVGPDGMRNIARAQRQAGTPLTSSDAYMVTLGGGMGAAAGGIAGAEAGGTALAATIGALGPPAARYLMRQYALRGQGARALGNATSATARTGARTTAAGMRVEDEDKLTRRGTR